MPKIALLADLHLHPFSEFSVPVQFQGISIGSRLRDQMTTLYAIGREAVSRGVTHLAIVGDVFHRRGAVPTEARQVFYNWLVWSREQGITVAISTGNHDQLDKLGQVHSLYDLKDACMVVDTTLRTEFGGADVVFFPYMESKDDILHCLEEGKGLEDDGKPDLFLGHIGIEGAYVGPVEYKIKSPITWKHLKAERFRWVLLGHYHKPQQIGKNGFYIGSPYQINRGERGEQKRWLLYDTETKKLTSIRTGAKEFKVITSSELISGEMSQHYYDVLLDSFAHPDEVATAAAKYSCKLIKSKPKSEVESRIKLHEGMTDDQLLKAYVFYKDANIKWVDIGAMILNESTQETSNYAKIDFQKLIVSNFMAIESATLKLNRTGRVTAVLGDNRDRPGYDSNGSGKSALLPEAIFWCLYGKTARKLPADKVVNRQSKRNCMVEVQVKLDGKMLRVIRFRKHVKLGGTGLILIQDGVDITDGTPELTETKLKNLLGIDYITFSSVIAFSPDNLRFVGSTDASQKQVLDSILQTRRFTAALALTKSMKSDVTQSRLSSNSARESTEGVLTTLQDTLDDYRTRNASWTERERARLEGVNNQIADIQEEHHDLEETVAEAVGRLEELRSVASSAEDNQLSISDSNDRVNTAYEHLVDMKACMNAVDGGIEDLQSKLDAANEQAGKPCPTCGVVVANTGRLIATYQKDRNKLLKAKENGQREVTMAEEALAAARVSQQTARSSVERVTLAKNAVNKQDLVLRQLASRNIELAKQVLKLREQLKSSVNEYDTLIPKVETQIEDKQSQLDSFDKDIAKNDKLLERLEFWMTAFGNAGIRSFLLDQILPSLTEYANEYSDVLTGGGIDISFESYNEDTMKDKFKIKAVNEDGSDIYEGNSSGEKRRVDICVMFALFRIAHTKTRVNILLLDEVLDTLDGSGLENVVDVVTKLAVDLGLGIYVTSHTTLNSMLHESITLEKHNGKSTLNG